MTETTQNSRHFLSSRLKQHILPKLLLRDGGFVCFYCKSNLSRVEYVFEHLDDDRTNNDLTNIVLACQSCNNKKPHDPAMKSKALDKKQQNIKHNLLRAGAREETSAPSFKPELDISNTNFDITNQYLLEVISVDGEIEYKTALDSVVMLCRRQTGTGSQSAVRRYIDALTSSIGDFMIIQNSEKKRMIVLRGGH